MRTGSISKVGLIISVFALSACGPTAGPDKTLAGAVLGAGWGAGAGIVVGNQVTPSDGSAAGLGAGFGAVAGAMAGASQDITESEETRLKNELTGLKVTNMANGNELASVQSKLDRAATHESAGQLYAVYFDADETDLKGGAVANLESIVNSLKRNPAAYKIIVTGHTDDTGNPEYNLRLAEARARTVAAILGSKGISMDQLIVKSYGSSRPVASNSTAEGRQLNRRVDISIGTERQS